MEEMTPHFASSNHVRMDADYMSWLDELKGRYRKSQIKAAVKVNSEQLLFNWQLGRDLVVRRDEEHWGAGIVEQVSLDLKAAFPKAKGFSTTNLWNMKKWYEFYSSNAATEKLQQLVGEIQQADNKTSIKLHQVGGEIQEQNTVVPHCFRKKRWQSKLCCLRKPSKKRSKKKLWTQKH